MSGKKSGSGRIYGGIGIGAAVAVAIGLAVALSSDPSSLNDSERAEAPVVVFSPDATPYGKTYEEWLVDWWTILQSEPMSSNPAADSTGELCHAGQDDPTMWFAFGNFGGTTERACTISSSQAIMINLLTSGCFDLEDASLDTDEKRRDCVIAGAKRGILSLTVDGQRISNLQDHWFESPMYDFPFPENNIWGVAPEVGNGYIGGYVVIVEPLPPGEHVVHFSAAALSIEGTQLFALDITYNLTVV